MKFRRACGLVVGSCLGWVVACGSSNSEHSQEPATDAGDANGATGGNGVPGAGRGGTSTTPDAGRAGATNDAGAGTLGGTGGTGGAGPTGGRAAAGGGGMPAVGGAGAGRSNGGAGAAGTTGSAGSAGTCSDAPPSVLFVVDTSLSMNEASSVGASKWEITAAVVADAVDALPEAWRVGLMFFPQTPQGRMPCFEGSLAVPFAPLDDAQRMSFRVALASTQPDGGTPTLDAYAFAEQEIAPLRDLGPTVIVLVTDGVPSYGLGCTGDGLATDPVDWAPLVAMVENASQTDTYTLAVAAPDSAETHEMLAAVASAGEPPGLCARNATPDCFFDLDVSFDLGLWLADSLPLASGCAP